LFLKNNFQYIILGLMVLFIGGYITYINVDRNSLKKKVTELQLVINQAKAREAALELGNTAITEKYKTALAGLDMQQDKINSLLQEKIKNDKELKSLRVSLNAIRLFNESKRDPVVQVTEAVEGNVGETNTAQEDSGSNGGSGITIPLTVVWATVAENDKNHWKCIKQVEAWQSFWKDYELNYTGATN